MTLRVLAPGERVCGQPAVVQVLWKKAKIEHCYCTLHHTLAAHRHAGKLRYSVLPVVPGVLCTEPLAEGRAKVDETTGEIVPVVPVEAPCDQEG